ncbi:DUF6082 family protein [Streptomyces sp. NPDC088789]|uniref:DUF6082 family protein n=1 Tax=Streptomyces sp. NPDC088789 TaxID=3365899 RepID=UPI0038275D5E
MKFTTVSRAGLLALGAVHLFQSARHHRDLVQLSLNEKHAEMLRAVAGSEALTETVWPECGHRETGQMLYANGWMSLWSLMLRTGFSSETHLRATLKGFMESETGRRYWERARVQRKATARSRYDHIMHDLADEAHAAAVAEACPGKADEFTRTLARYTAPPPRRAGTQGLVIWRGKVAMVTREYLGDQDDKERWGLPGGHARAGESHPEALRRLLATRLGVQAEVGKLLAVDYVPAGRFVEGQVHIYRVDLPADAEPALTEESGFGSLRWVDAADISSLYEDPDSHSYRRLRHTLNAYDTGTAAELHHGHPRTSAQAA